MYWDDVEHHIGPERLSSLWMSHPRVRAAINERVSGDAAVWPLEWFREQFGERLPLANVLSVGAGTGDLERDLVRKNIATFVTGIDVVEAPLRAAAEAAVREGIDGRIAYVRADAREYLARHPGMFDAIFFHGALHHFDHVDELMMLARAALAPKGLLYADEYVGPAMRQWTARRLVVANVAYYLLGRRVRRPRLVRAPVNAQDPTEMIAANEIIPAIRRHFSVLAERDYGGNLLGVIYPNLRRDDPEQLDRAVVRLLRYERVLLRFVRSHHAVVVAN